jgi:hypothetical protein
MRKHMNFRFQLVPRSDHTFSTVAGQRTLLRALREYMEAVHEPQQRTGAVVAQPVATT